MKELKELLKKGETIIFDSSEFCERNQRDDFRSAECTFRNEIQHSWANGFEIRFNGNFFTFKTFKGFENKINKLILDWNLELKS